MRALHWGSWSLESQQRNIEVAVTIFAHDRDITCRTLVTFWIAAKNPTEKSLAVPEKLGPTLTSKDSFKTRSRAQAIPGRGDSWICKLGHPNRLLHLHLRVTGGKPDTCTKVSVSSQYIYIMVLFFRQGNASSFTRVERRPVEHWVAPTGNLRRSRPHDAYARYTLFVISRYLNLRRL